jgi:hypothetical protein
MGLTVRFQGDVTQAGGHRRRLRRAWGPARALPGRGIRPLDSKAVALLRDGVCPRRSVADGVPGMGPWTYTHKTVLRISAVALAALIFVFWGQPTARVVIGITIGLLVVLGLIELIGRPPTQPKPKTAAPPGGLHAEHQ